MKEKLKIYINNNFNNSIFSLSDNFELYGYIKSNLVFKSYNDYINHLIEISGLKNNIIYKRMNIDKRTLYRLKNSLKYNPSKDMLIKLGLALNISESDMDYLLSLKGYTLSNTNYFDLIIRFCFINHIYDIYKVNDLLMEYHCKLL